MTIIVLKSTITENKKTKIIIRWMVVDECLYQLAVKSPEVSELDRENKRIRIVVLSSSWITIR